MISVPARGAAKVISRRCQQVRLSGSWPECAARLDGNGCCRLPLSAQVVRKLDARKGFHGGKWRRDHCRVRLTPGRTLDAGGGADNRPEPTIGLWPSQIPSENLRVSIREGCADDAFTLQTRRSRDRHRELLSGKHRRGRPGDRTASWHQVASACSRRSAVGGRRRGRSLAYRPAAKVVCDRRQRLLPAADPRRRGTHARARVISDTRIGART